MKTVVGVCDLHNCPSLSFLSEKHGFGAVSFLGRYSLMDFVLTSFTYSNIDRVFIYVDRHFSSIKSHVEDGSTWIKNTKKGYQVLLINEDKMAEPSKNTDTSNYFANKGILDQYTCDYVVVASPEFLYCCDYQDIVNECEKYNGEPVLLYKKVSKNFSEFKGTYSLNIKDKNVTSVSKYNGDKEANIYLQCFVCSRPKFREMSLYFDEELSFFDNLIKNINKFDLHIYPFDGEVYPVLSLDLYAKQSFKLLSDPLASNLVPKSWSIFTTTHNTPPCLYGKKANVKSSFVSNGSIINGTVENSIICREVIVEEGAVVKNCILFTKTKIGKNVKVENLITDKSVVIESHEDIENNKERLAHI